MDASRRHPCWLLAAALFSLTAGCETPAGPQFQWWSSHRLDEPAQKAAEHRRQFQQQGDAESFRWLLGNAIASGMTLSDVEHALGSEGERVWDDQKFKTGGAGRYQQTDETYKWGPDSGGSSAFLVFRDEKLVNYDPKAYRKD